MSQAFINMLEQLFLLLAQGATLTVMVFAHRCLLRWRQWLGEEAGRWLAEWPTTELSEPANTSLQEIPKKQP
jgi:hypothetical protein